MVTIEGSAAISRIGMTGDGKLLISYKSSPKVVYRSYDKFIDEEVSDLITRKINKGESMGAMVPEFVNERTSQGMENIGDFSCVEIHESEWKGSFKRHADFLFGEEVEISEMVKDWQQQMLSINTHNAWSW